MEHVARLIEEAWERRNRRYRSAILGMLLVSAATIAGLLVGRSEDPTQAATGATYRSEPSEQVVSRTALLFAPDQALGAHCAVLNSLACDSVTVRLFLRRPAVSVVASIYGRTMTLEPGDHYAPITQPAGVVTTAPRAGTAFSGRLDPSASSLPPSRQAPEGRPSDPLACSRHRATAGPVPRGHPCEHELPINEPASLVPNLKLLKLPL